jgi:hypothetical protein
MNKVNIAMIRVCGPNDYWLADLGCFYQILQPRIYLSDRPHGDLTGVIAISICVQADDPLLSTHGGIIS